MALAVAEIYLIKQKSMWYDKREVKKEKVSKREKESHESMKAYYSKNETFNSSFDTN